MKPIFCLLLLGYTYIMIGGKEGEHMTYVYFIEMRSESCIYIHRPKA